MNTVVRLTAAYLLIGSPIAAQSLAIGGVELHLGQSGTSARAALSSAYDLKYYEDGDFWLVIERARKSNGEFVILGNIGIKNELVVRLAQSFPLSGPYDVSRAYTQGIRELEKRGGKACNTAPVEYSTGLFSEVRTVGPFTSD
jgi:hypothetical protein